MKGFGRGYNQQEKKGKGQGMKRRVPSNGQSLPYKKKKLKRTSIRGRKNSKGKPHGHERKAPARKSNRVRTPETSKSGKVRINNDKSA